MVVACIALAVSLSGVGYAAVVIPRNSVGTAQLKTNAVVSSKVRNNSLTGLDIRNDSLTGADVNEASLGRVPSARVALTAGSAADADRLDGLDASAFQRAGAAAGGALAGSYPSPALADGAVTAGKIAADAIDASKVQNGTLRLEDLAVWTVAGNVGGTTTPANGCSYFNFVSPAGCWRATWCCRGATKPCPLDSR